MGQFPRDRKRQPMQLFPGVRFQSGDSSGSVLAHAPLLRCPKERGTMAMRKIELLANHYRLAFSKGPITVYQYEVTIVSDTMSRFSRWGLTAIYA